MSMLFRRLPELFAIHQSKCIHWNRWKCIHFFLNFYTFVCSEAQRQICKMSFFFHSNLRWSFFYRRIKSVSQTDVEFAASVYHQFDWWFCAVFGENFCDCDHSFMRNGNATTKGEYPSHVGSAHIGWNICISHFTLFHHCVWGSMIFVFFCVSSRIMILIHRARNFVSEISFFSPCLLQLIIYGPSQDDYRHDILVLLRRLWAEWWPKPGILHANESHGFRTKFQKSHGN